MPERDDLKLLEDAVRAAGAIARKFYGGDYRRWSKEGGSPVTEADLAVNSYLCETLTSARPGYGWLSEESADNLDRLSRREVFVVDPIDGTVAFLKGRPHFTICAAVVRDGVAVAGVVHNPMLDHLYKAADGGGAFRNGETIHVGAAHSLEGCRANGDDFRLLGRLNRLDGIAGVDRPLESIGRNDFNDV